MSKPILLLFSYFIIFGCISITAQERVDIGTAGIPWEGAKGISETVTEIIAREKRQPPQIFAIKGRKEFHLPRKTQDNPLAPAVSQWPPSDEKQNLQQPFGITAPQTIGVNFLGVQISETPGYVPPDCIGDVGPTQIFVHVNGRVKVFNKNGTLGSLNVSDNTFWQSVRNGADLTDPRVRYDRISSRWFILIINMPASGANRILIAVSSGPTITNTSSFTFFQFQHDQVGTTPNTDTSGFADYPTLGVDSNALYIGANIFNPITESFIGTSVYIIKKSNLLNGTLTVTPFRQLTNGSTTGPFTPQGVNNDDPTASEGYFIGVDAVTFSKLIIRRVTNPGGTPSLSGNISLTVPTTTYPMNQPAQGSTNSLDGVDDRLFNAHVTKNKITGVTSLWTTHNIEVNSSGVGSSTGNRNGSRWYEITNLSTTPILRQSGTLYSSATTNPIGYWIPSVAMSGQGHMALGCSYASAVNYAGVAVAGRLSSDALGSTQSPTVATTSLTSYNAESGSTQRWGDYSQVVVDPNDDMTMWTFQEYCNATNSWGLRVIQLIAPPPATPLSSSPPTVERGASNVDVVITGTSISGSGFYDPGSGFTNRIVATVNGGGVTVNSITFTNPTSVILNISVASDATLDTRTITITNPDGQTVSSPTGIITITSSCPTITLTPLTLPEGIVGVPYGQSISANGGTTPYSFSVTSGSLPAGLSLSSSGLLSGMPTNESTYNFTITVTDSNDCVDSCEYTLNILCPEVSIEPSILPDDSVGRSYHQQLSASGGTPPYTFDVSDGNLPNGLLLSSNGAISGTLLTGGTYDFDITATDSNECTITRLYRINVLYYSVAVSVPLNAGWNIVSNPVLSFNDSAHILFPSVTEDAFSYDGNGYQSKSRIESGFGYWIRSNVVDTAIIIGEPRSEDSVEVNEGWNLVGSLSTSIPTSAVSGLGNNIQSNFFGYTDNYHIIDSLAPGKGFWVKLDGSGKLIFTTPVVSSKANPISLNYEKAFTSLNKLIFEDAQKHRQVLYFGKNNDLHVQPYSELPPLPPAGIFDVRFESQRMAEVYTAPLASSETHEIRISAESYPISIGWEVNQNSDEVFRLLIREDGILLKNIHIVGYGKVTLCSSTRIELVLKIQSKNDFPQKFALYQNHPNPFNPTTFIGYELPVESKVSIKIYNLLGQIIQILKDEVETRGHYSVEWNTSASARFTSGMYFYKLEAICISDPSRIFSQVNKMILLK